uniref:Uncharacterized protein n=1 Tax=Panagrolaimus davidi TaxID=227884 RepID=A0A914Q693_9BILA
MDPLDDFGFNEMKMNVSNKVQNVISVKTSSSKKIILSSKIENFKIQVGPKVIKACSILKNVLKFTNDAESIIEVEMTQKQLEKFIELHEHFSEDDPWNKKEQYWMKKFFSKMSDEDFKELCWKADYLDSQRFLNNAAFYLLSKLQTMKIADFQQYLNIVNDYSEDEKQAIKDGPFKYFTSIAIEQENLELENIEDNRHVFYPLKKHKMEFIFQKQNFSFPKSLINFTFTTSMIPKDLFYKLYSTCKYFFLNLKLLPCQRLRAGIYETNNFHISYGNELIDLPLTCVKNLNANFYICHEISETSRCSPENLNILLKKIIRHEITYACVVNKDLTLTVSEFMFLFTYVKDAVLCMKVFDANNKMVPVEDLLQLLPNVQNFK